MQNLPFRVGRGLAPAEKSHRFRGGLWASRPTFVSPRKLRISFPILRHGFAVPPPLPKEANAAVSFRRHFVGDDAHIVPITFSAGASPRPTLDLQYGLTIH